MWCCSCFAKTYEAPEIFELDYRHSSLNEVPHDVFIYESTLEKLDLGCNQISDLPPSLFHCHELKELDLCDNDLVSIPPAIGSLTRLAKLDLSRNAIAEIADNVKNCKNLVYLDLSLNHLQKLPEGISQLLNLEELFLNDTYLEFLQANFGKLTKLKVLELRENSLQTLPKSMTRLHHLQRIDIGQNDIFELPEVIGTMTNLTELWIDNNSLRSIPKFIGNLTKLNCLDASQNDIQEISDEIGKCIQLSDLTLASNSLESLPDSFPKLENLTVLRLDSNSIQYLPEDIGNLKNLQELTLIRNLLKTLPASIGLMRKLHTLYLDDNLLSALPKEIGSCAALSVLSVAKNRLAIIPSEVGHLTNLKVLTLSGNLLVNLPVSLLNIVKLGALWLSESQSKPLNPLNKEIDPSNGQHVLTCYLLPQMPSTQTEADLMAENDENLPPRRSRPSIKFCTDLEAPPIVEQNVNKRGLLRAPTPYPKELRALAKHASHLRSKDQNGDIIINDEPVYDGDYGDEEMQDAKNLMLASSNGDHFDSRKSTQPALPVKDYSEEDAATINPSGRSLFSYHSYTAVAGPQTPLLSSTIGITENTNTLAAPPISNSNNNNIDTTQAGSAVEQNNGQQHLHHYPTQTNISLIDPYPAVVDSTGLENASNGGSFMKHENGPPPYHVAARRAAFFRSTPSSPISTTPTTVNTPQQQQSSSILPHDQNQRNATMFPMTSNHQHQQMVDNRPTAQSSHQYLMTDLTQPQQQTITTTSLNIPQVLTNVPNTNSGELQQHSKVPATNTTGRSNEVDLSNVREKSALEQQKTFSAGLGGVQSQSPADSNAKVKMHWMSTQSTPYTTTVVETTKTVTAESIMAEALEKKFQEISESTLSSQQQQKREQQQKQPMMEPVSSSYIEKMESSNVMKTSEISSSTQEVLNDIVIGAVDNNESKSIRITTSTFSPTTTTTTATTASTKSEKSNNNEQANNNWSNIGSGGGGGGDNNVVDSGSEYKVVAFPPSSISGGPNLHRSNSVSSQENNGSSRIPVLSPTKIINPIHSNTVEEASEVPHHQHTQSFLSSQSYTDSPNSTNNNSGWSRIPKLPNINSNQNIATNFTTTNSNIKPEIVGPKPILVKTTSGSRIPSAFPESRINNNKPVPPLPLEPRGSHNINLNSVVGTSSVTQMPQMTTTTAMTSPTSSGLSRIPRFGNDPQPPQAPVSVPQQQQKQLQQQDNTHSHRLERTASGSRIPKFNDGQKSKAAVVTSPTNTATSAATHQPDTEIPQKIAVESDPQQVASPVGGNTSGGSRIPTVATGRKPWIFGTHRNARVVPVEYTKLDKSLGFTIIDSSTGEGNGIYVDVVEGQNSAVKVGDKILRIDDIDVSNMSIDIVRKILSNCQENIHLLVSRHY